MTPTTGVCLSAWQTRDFSSEKLQWPELRDARWWTCWACHARKAVVVNLDAPRYLSVRSASARPTISACRGKRAVLMPECRLGLEHWTGRNLALRTLCARLSTSLRLAPRSVPSNCAHLRHGSAPSAPRSRPLAMGHRDIASFFGKPAGSGAVQAGKATVKPDAASAPGAKSSPAAAKGGSSKRAVATQIAAAPASAEEASPPAEAAAMQAPQPANGAAPSKVLRETKNTVGEVGLHARETAASVHAALDSSSAPRGPCLANL